MSNIRMCSNLYDFIYIKFYKLEHNLDILIK